MMLREKGVIVNCPCICVLCNNNDEDSLHIFFKRPSSCDVWRSFGLSQTVSDVVNQIQDASNIVFQILQQLKNEEAALFGYVL